MDRRKAEAQSQLQTLQQECEITTDLLNNLIKVCSKHVEDIANLDSESFRRYSKYFLAVLQFQSASIQKIIEWNIDLEEFLIEGPADLEHCRIINSRNRSSTSSESDTRSESASFISSSSFVQNTSKTESILAINKTNVESKASPENNIIDKTNISATVEAITGTVKKNVEKPNIDVPLKIHTEVEVNTLINSDCGLEAIHEGVSRSPSVDETIVADYDDFQMPCNVLNESVSSSEYFYSTSSLYSGHNPAETDLEDASSYAEFASDLEAKETATQSKTDSEDVSYAEFASDLEAKETPAQSKTDSKDVSSYAEFASDLEAKEKPTQSKADSDVTLYPEFSTDSKRKEKPKQRPPSNISERLKTLPMVSLQDKFFKSLPRAPMPDLALRPSSELETSKPLPLIPSKQLDIPVSSSLTLENINKAFRSEHDKNVTKSKVKKKTNVREFQEYKNAEDLLGIDNREAPKIGDICTIGYVESPSELYIQVADENSDSLDILSMQLSELYEDSSFVFASKTDAMKKLGNFWTLNSGTHLFRVEVVDWMLNDEPDKVVVQLVDYGGKYIVSYKDLQHLDVEFRNIPRMAQLCHLGYLYPPGSTKHRKLKTWPSAANDGFYKILGDLDNTAFKIVHVHYCLERRSYEIDLIKTEEEDRELTIGQILVDYKLAVELFDDNSELLKNDIMKDQLRTAHGLNGITSDMPIDEVLETYFQENADEEVATINEAVMHYDAKDEAETCRNLRPNGTCYKGKSCKFRHVPLTSGFTRDQEPVYNRAYEEIPLPCTNDEVFVTISHIVDIRCFYAQIRRENCLAGCPGPTLNSLIKTMNNSDVVKSYKKLRLPPSREQMVIAKHWNSFWYRGQVRDVRKPEDNNKNVVVEVYIVDFGDTLDVPMSDLRVITPDFLFMSFQAVECSLYNVKHKNGLDPSDEKKHFERQYLGQTFKAIVMGVPGHLEVLLENDNGEDIGLKLIEDGFGELNTDHCFPADNERLLID